MAELEASAIVPSVAAVTDTPELLEAILLQLDTRKKTAMKTLLLSQRVCKTFNATIRGSIKLQQALFLRPRSVPNHSGAKTKHEPDTYNPLLVQRLGNGHISELKAEHFSIEALHNGGATEPLIFKLYTKDSTPFETAIESIKHSWARMLLYQPSSIRTVNVAWACREGAVP